MHEFELSIFSKHEGKFRLFFPFLLIVFILSDFAFGYFVDFAILDGGLVGHCKMPEITTCYHIAILVNELKRQYFGWLAHLAHELSKAYIYHSGNDLPVVELLVKIDNTLSLAHLFHL